MADMKKESVALHEMVISSGGEPDGCVDEMSSLLKRLKDCVITQEPASEALGGGRSSSIKHRSPIIPDEFRCPISLELMQDPVIVSSGQVHLLDYYYATLPVIPLRAHSNDPCLLLFSDVRAILHPEVA
jgi:hypothetical protein